MRTVLQLWNQQLPSTGYALTQDAMHTDWSPAHTVGDRITDLWLYFFRFPNLNFLGVGDTPLIVFILQLVDAK